MSIRKKMCIFSSKSEEESLVNLTPLIDVLFVVLILFILIAPFLEFDRISLASGGEASEQNHLPVHHSSLKIQVFADNTIRVNKMDVLLEEFTDIMKQYQKELPSAVPQIYLDKQTFFGTYQMLKNGLEAAGFEQMDVILKKGKAGVMLDERKSE